jgi:hypothetical protein
VNRFQVAGPVVGDPNHGCQPDDGVPGKWPDKRKAARRTLHPTKGVLERVCRQDWCLGAVLDVLLDFLDAVADGESTEHALCMSLADRFDASAAALISFDAETSTATVTAWPHTIDMVRMKFVLDRLADAFPLFMRQLLMDRQARCLSASADPDSYRGTVAAMLVSEVLGCQDSPASPRRPPHMDKKRAEGKTRAEALRCLKRRLSDVVYRTLLDDHELTINQAKATPAAA